MALEPVRGLTDCFDKWLVGGPGLRVEPVERLDRGVVGVPTELPGNPRVVDIGGLHSRAFGERQHRVEAKELAGLTSGEYAWIHSPLDLGCDVVQVAQLATWRISSAI